MKALEAVVLIAFGFVAGVLFVAAISGIKQGGYIENYYRKLAIKQEAIQEGGVPSKYEVLFLVEDESAYIWCGEEWREVCHEIP